MGNASAILPVCLLASSGFASYSALRNFPRAAGYPVRKDGKSVGRALHFHPSVVIKANSSSPWVDDINRNILKVRSVASC